MVISMINCSRRHVLILTILKNQNLNNNIIFSFLQICKGASSSTLCYILKCHCFSINKVIKFDAISICTTIIIIMLLYFFLLNNDYVPVIF